MKSKVIPPAARQEKFTCPHCGAISGQLWGRLTAAGDVSRVAKSSTMVVGSLRNTSQWGYIISHEGDWIMSSCENCEKICIWRNEKMVYPDIAVVDQPNDDLPEDIKKDYLEAASILNKSPRGAAALLRLCVQKLCKYLGEKGKNLNDDIGDLAKGGLSPTIIKAMDALRVTGDNAVHPGELDINDNPEIAIKLFQLVNFIADKMITEPKEINSFYNETIPESAKDAIEKRGKRK